MTSSYHVTIEGVAPLLMHADNIEYADKLKAWRSDPANKKNSVAGDDRSPAHTWLGCLYNEDGLVVMSSDNISRCIMEGGAMVPVPGGKNGKTFKAQTQSGMVVTETAWPVIVDGKEISYEKICERLEKEKDFSKHVEFVKTLGFSLFTKRAKIGTSKHVRVRPKFHRWTISGQVDVWDDQITETVLTQIFEYAGSFKGLGDWRPSSKTPGPYGRFKAAVKEI